MDICERVWGISQVELRPSASLESKRTPTHTSNSMPIKPSWLFALGAAWNLVIGLSIMFAPLSSLRLLYGHEPSADDQLLMMLDRDFASCVLLFGVGYGIVASAPSRNHGLIWLGIIGKLG